MRIFKNSPITVQATILFIAFIGIYLLCVAAALALNKDRPAYFLPEERNIIYQYYHQSSPSKGLPRDWQKKASCHRAYRSTWTRMGSSRRDCKNV